MRDSRELIDKKNVTLSNRNSEQTIEENEEISEKKSTFHFDDTDPSIGNIEVPAFLRRQQQ